MQALQYILHHWLQLTVDSVAALNIIAAGSRAMGWMRLSEECGKLENAITAMVQAFFNRNKKDEVKP